MALNRNLNVPWGWARWRIGFPKSRTRPFPTVASIAITPFCRYPCPQAQPLRNGVFESNHASAFTPRAAASGPSLKTGLLSKNTSVCSFMPHAIGLALSTLALRTEPGT